jgi:hypothetical protein
LRIGHRGLEGTKLIAFTSLEVIVVCVEVDATVDGSSGATPRVLPPWLQAQTPGSGSYSVSQDAPGDFSDVKSNNLDEKKLSEVEAQDSLKHEHVILPSDQLKPYKTKMQNHMIIHKTKPYRHEVLKGEKLNIGKVRFILT